jgi:hypothetical protein
MKLNFEKCKEYREHIDYIAEIDKERSVHMVLPKVILREDAVVHYFPVYIHTSSVDKTKHLCHKCRQLYPAFQYRKHAEETHNE